MPIVTRPAQRSDLPMLGEALEGPLFFEPVRAWCWIAEDLGRTIGYVLGASLFSTWHVKDTFDIWQLTVIDPVRYNEIAAALFDRVHRHATENKMGGVRWLFNEPPPDFLDALTPDLRDKVRFTLSVPPSSVPPNREEHVRG
jgi:hypothetical protein